MTLPERLLGDNSNGWKAAEDCVTIGKRFLMRGVGYLCRSVTNVLWGSIEIVW